MATLVFRDPVFDGAADPVVLWNRKQHTWWMFYTSRRATAPSQGFSWVHGSDIGVAESSDGGLTWLYRGVVELEHEFGRNTFWAPEVLWADGAYHMFVSYVKGVPETWHGHRRNILHYVSGDLEDWAYCEPLSLNSDYVIDAAVHELPNGGYRLWYKDESQGVGTTWAADSTDLRLWHDFRRVLSTPGGHEGPNVFYFEGFYWLIVDSWEGQLVFRSQDLSHWQPTGRILDPASACPQVCAEDTGPGFHADVLAQGTEAYIFYFTHAQRYDNEPARDCAARKRSAILVCELEVRDGIIVCDRSRKVALRLLAGEDSSPRDSP